LDQIVPQREVENPDEQNPDEQNPDEQNPVYTDDEIQFHFLTLGNKYTGDCTLVKVGDTEVLIDAGSRQGSAATIVEYVSEYCTDGVLEYVIATHADQDHIAAFVGTKTAPGIFDSFDCKTIIDFPLTNKTTQIYQNYVSKRDAEVVNGATHYTALECWNNANGANRTYTLGEGITMNFLYQKFYEEKTSRENDYSVCTLFTQGNNHYLFTGDLEAEGEASLVENNDLPKCKLYKAGHHGSKTSSTAELLAIIQPEIICVCCCCGSTEYTDNMENTFSAQAFVDRIAQYTDKVYVTTIVFDNKDGFEQMNGNIVVKSNGGEVSVTCSNSNELFKDWEWFKNNRVCPKEWE
jgi:competence protein ComEC